MPFLASSDKASFDSGTSAGGGITGALEQAATATTAITAASRTTALDVIETLVCSNALSPASSSPFRGLADY
jgi:hypothetical protein